MFGKIAWIALAGAVAALARWGVTSLIKSPPGHFPWGTLTVNMLGCFGFGLVYALAQERGVLSREVSTIILIGFMGTFTTFSTYTFDIQTLLVQQKWLLGAGYFIAQNTLGLAGVFLGIWAGK